MKQRKPSKNREKAGAGSPLPAFFFDRRLPAFLLAAALLCTAPCLPARASGEYADFMCPFSDVTEDEWFYADVCAAYALGLVNGKSADLFAPRDGILLCEAVKLAACMHQRHETGSVTLENGSGLWYSTYTEYALEHGILSDALPAAEWDRPATRGEIMEFFSRAVPLDEINDVPAGSVPDVPADHPHAEAIYALFRAGIVQGNDPVTHIFAPDENVTRAETAATLTRMTDPSARLHFSVTAPDGDGSEPDEPSPEDAFMEDGADALPEDALPEAGDADAPTGEDASGGDVPAESVPGEPIPGRTYSDLTARWAALYEERFGPGSADEPLLDGAGIDAYNAVMTSSCPTMPDLASYPSYVSGGSVVNMILSYDLPEGYNYTKNGAWIGEDEKETILSNRAISEIPETVEVRFAVVTARCDLKSFPMADGFYPYGNPGFNRAQETELSVGMPAAVLHRSADGIYLFVQAYHYAGWIPAWACAYCGPETFRQFVLRSPEDGVTVTSAGVTANGVRLDMGVWLPRIGESGDGYEVLLPVRGSDGTYAETVAVLPTADAVPGRLPYTMRNFYEQAFRYLGTPYGWGGADGGVDCSGFVGAVMRSFGILIPRNTTEQRFYSGTSSDISVMSAGDRLARFASSRFPVALHRQGHVMLYLGESDGLLWIVHAQGIGQPVCVASLDPGSDLLRMVELYR